MTGPKAYTLLVDRFEHKAGTTIYDCFKHDYGCANDDTRFTGIEHRSYTLDPEGDYPFFTAAVRDVKATPSDLADEAGI